MSFSNGTSKNNILFHLSSRSFLTFFYYYDFPKFVLLNLSNRENFNVEKLQNQIKQLTLILSKIQ